MGLADGELVLVVSGLGLARPSMERPPHMSEQRVLDLFRLCEHGEHDHTTIGKRAYSVGNSQLTLKVSVLFLFVPFCP